jgi:hypothetical protein
MEAVEGRIAVHRLTARGEVLGARRWRRAAATSAPATAAEKAKETKDTRIPISFPFADHARRNRVVPATCSPQAPLFHDARGSAVPDARTLGRRSQRRYR